MGYSVFLLHADFHITREAHPLVLSVIKELDPKKDFPGTRDPHFAFVTTSLYQQANTLGEALRAWRWLPDFDEAGNIIGIEFLGEKLGNEEILFTSIAPFVRDGSYIQMAGEDGQIWRWLFCSGGIQKQTGIVEFHSNGS